MAATISLKFGTLALDSTNNITISRISEKASKPVQSFRIPVTDGEIAETAKIGSKTITVEGDIAGSSYDNLRTNLDALHSGLLNGLQKLTKDDERYIYCQLKDFSYAYDHLSRRATWSAQFIAHFPFWLSLMDNEISNEGFELWAAGASSAPDDWTLTGGGASVAKETTIIKAGSASAALTRAGNDASLYQRIDAAKGLSHWQGKKITLNIWVYATVASRARIHVNDGTAATYSSYHTGGSAWELLTLTVTLDAAATLVNIYCDVDGGDTTAYFDKMIITEGENITAANVIDERVPTSGTSYTITNAGNAPARAKIEITPTASMADSCKIENITTGKSFQYRGTVAANQTLEVDNRYDTDDFQVLNNSVDDHTNFEGDFIEIASGVNTIIFTGTASTAVKITFRNCWY